MFKFMEEINDNNHIYTLFITNLKVAIMETNTEEMYSNIPLKTRVKHKICKSVCETICKYIDELPCKENEYGIQKEIG